MNRLPSYGLLCWLLATTAGCAVGPDFQRLAAPDTQRYLAVELPEHTTWAPGLAGNAQRLVPGQEVASEWWRAFGSPALDDIVSAALAANPDLQAAEAALRAARETATAQRGAFWPSLEAGLKATREQEAEPDAAPFTLQTPKLSLSYVPDVFGGKRRELEALNAEVDVQHFEREAVYMTLVANVVTTAIEEASVRAQIAVTQELIALSTQVLEVTRRQHRAGEVGGIDVAAQETALAQAQASLPPLDKQLAEQRHRLAVLSGRLPSDQPEQRFALEALTLPLELPLSVPARLVEQRPDIRAAEAQLHAASAQIGVAAAARLPSITLSASVGRSAAKASQLCRAGGSVWDLGAELLLPVFNGGELLHQQRAAQAAYEQAAAQYRSTVLVAFQDTADTLQAIVSDAQTLRAASNAEAAARRSLGMARRQRELGAAPQADLILAQQSYQEAALALVEARASRYSNTVALYQALGGWWQAPSPPAAAPTAASPLTLTSTPILTSTPEASPCVLSTAC